MWKWFISMFTNRRSDERTQRVEADTERTRLSTKRTDDVLRTLDRDIIGMRLRLIERRKREQEGR